MRPVATRGALLFAADPFEAIHEGPWLRTGRCAKPPGHEVSGAKDKSEAEDLRLSVGTYIEQLECSALWRKCRDHGSGAQACGYN